MPERQESGKTSQNRGGNPTMSANQPYQQQPYQPAPPAKKPMSKEARIGWIILASVGAVALVAVAVSPDKASESVTKPSTVVTSVDTGPSPEPVVTPTNKPSPPAATKTAPAPKPTKTAPKMTASQEQAIGAAESYLEFTAFSRKGLIRQLSSDAGEGFSVADATFAVDHIKVNWNEQAAKAARSYLEMTHFSRKGLIHQLESDAGDGFTHAQAVYGVNKAGL